MSGLSSDCKGLVLRVTKSTLSSEGRFCRGVQAGTRVTFSGEFGYGQYRDHAKVHFDSDRYGLLSPETEIEVVMS